MDEHQPTTTTHHDLINFLLQDGLGEGLPKIAERFGTTDGYDDPDCTNGRRAAFATTALDVFQKTCRMTENVDTAAGDLIAEAGRMD